MITYRTDFIADIKPLWGAIAMVQDRMEPREFIAKILGASQSPLWATTAWDGAKCAGVMMFWKARDIAEAKRVLADLGLDPFHFVIRNNIYVHPDYRGQKISMGLYAHQNAYLIAQGITGGVGYGYETDEIASWARHLPNATIHEMKDKAGYSVVISRFAP